MTELNIKQVEELLDKRQEVFEIKRQRKVNRKCAGLCLVFGIFLLVGAAMSLEIIKYTLPLFTTVQIVVLSFGFILLLLTGLYYFLLAGKYEKEYMKTFVEIESVKK